MYFNQETVHILQTHCNVVADHNW